MSKSSESNKITYPSSLIDKSCVCSSKFTHPLTELNIHFHIQDRVFLATFLSCCLCKFVLSSKDGGFIYPIIFKGASMIVAERQFSLAILILISIVKDISEIQFALVRLHETSFFLFIFLAVGLQKKLARIKQLLALSS
jgi:hypothetical protein